MKFKNLTHITYMFPMRLSDSRAVGLSIGFRTCILNFRYEKKILLPRTGCSLKISIKFLHFLYAYAVYLVLKRYESFHLRFNNIVHLFTGFKRNMRFVRHEGARGRVTLWLAADL